MKKFLIGAVILLGVGGVAYLATLGCCQVMSRSRPAPDWIERRSLTPEQRQAVAEADKQFVSQKEASCGILCAKRAQMIQLLKQPEPDRTTLVQLTEEIGQEQTLLEKATLDHLLAVGSHLDPDQRQKMMASVAEELRTACNETACGMKGNCMVQKGKKKQ